MRDWGKNTGEEITAFIGILLLYEEVKLGSKINYWIRQTDKLVSSSIQSVMSATRWHQIKRYVKISNPKTGLGSAGVDWYTKVEPLYPDFVNASMASFQPGRNVLVEERLILFKGRCRHTMQIETKATGVGFKIYSL